jgi:hypothetical protein
MMTYWRAAANLQRRQTSHFCNTMRLLVTLSLLFGLCAVQSALAQSSAAAETTSTESTSSAGNSTVNDEVAFLQTLQAAQVSSMSCLITLVNMTVNPIGSCLGLADLSTLVVRPSDNSSFSDQLSTYLDTVCAGSQCTDAVVGEAKQQLADSCGASKDTELVKVVQAILDNYTNSYRTLACSVHL